MQVKALVTAAVTTSAIAIVICLIAAACMFADLNDFFDEAMKDMEEFEV